MNDLIIKQGKLINGQIVDILVRNSKIVAIGPDATKEQQATKTIDLKGQLYISDCWIDAHTHCYPESLIYFNEPDLAGASCGVTRLVYAGSVWADDIDHFFTITRKVKANVYSLLNIAKTGIISQNELADMQQIDEASLQKYVADHPEFIVGIKARMSKSVVGENGINPLVKAKEMQKKWATLNCTYW